MSSLLYNSGLYVAEARPWTCEDFCACACAVLWPDASSSPTAPLGMRRLLELQQLAGEEVERLQDERTPSGGSQQAGQMVARFEVDRSFGRSMAHAPPLPQQTTFGEWKRRLASCNLFGQGIDYGHDEDVDFSAFVLSEPNGELRHGKDGVLRFLLKAFAAQFEYLSAEIGCESMHELRQLLDGVVGSRLLVSLARAVRFLDLSWLPSIRNFEPCSSMLEDPSKVLVEKLACAYVKRYYPRLSIDQMVGSSYPLINLYHARGIIGLIDGMYTQAEMRRARADNEQYLEASGARCPFAAIDRGELVCEPFTSANFVYATLRLMSSEVVWVARPVLAPVVGDLPNSVTTLPYLVLLRRGNLDDWQLCVCVLDYDVHPTVCSVQHTQQTQINSLGDFEQLLRSECDLLRLKHPPGPGRDLLLYFHRWGQGRPLFSVPLTSKLVSCENEVSGGKQSSSSKNPMTSSESSSGSSSSSLSIQPSIADADDAAEAEADMSAAIEAAVEDEPEGSSGRTGGAFMCNSPPDSSI